MLRTCVVDLKPFHLDRTGNCKMDRDVNGVYRPKGLDKEQNILDPIQNVRKFSKSLVNYTKTMQPRIKARNQK